MAVLPPETASRVRELTREEGHQLFDRAARRHLGISGEEFIRRWDAGEYVGKADVPGVSTVAMLLPFGR